MERRAGVTAPQKSKTKRSGEVGQLKGTEESSSLCVASVTHTLKKQLHGRAGHNHPCGLFVPYSASGGWDPTPSHTASGAGAHSPPRPQGALQQGGTRLSGQAGPCPPLPTLWPGVLEFLAHSASPWRCPHPNPLGVVVVRVLVVCAPVPPPFPQRPCAAHGWTGHTVSVTGPAPRPPQPKLTCAATRRQH